MIPLLPGEIAQMRGTQQAAMMDTCRRLVWTYIGEDELGNPIYDYVPGAILICGLNPDPAKELAGETQLTVADARLRLAIGTVLDNRDRLEILTRNGEALDPAPIYEIIGQPRRGVTGLLLDLRTVRLTADVP